MNPEDVVLQYAFGLLLMIAGAILIGAVLGWQIGAGVGLMWLGHRMFDGATRPPGG